MKKLMIMLVMAILVAMPVFSQGEWTVVSNPDPQMRNLYSIVVTPNGNIHIVGEYGRYIRGSNLYDLDSRPYPANYVGDLKKILATEEGTLYICSGAILKSTDDGDSWTILYAGSTYLNDITFWDENHGVAVGNDGLILRTTDGGTTWNQAVSPTTEDISHVEIDTVNNLLVIMTANNVWRSYDYGQTWEDVTPENVVYLRAIKYSPSGNYWVLVGVGSFNVRSLDNCTTWTHSAIPGGSQSIRTLTFCHNGETVITSSWTSSQPGKLLISTDAGESYEFMTSDIALKINYLTTGPSEEVWLVGDDGLIAYNPSVPVSIDHTNQQIPDGYVLNQNYPNPFNPSTTVEYSIPVSGMCTFTVYNFLGQEIKTIVNEFQPAGSYRVTLDGSDLPSGTYIYKLQSNGISQSHKMVLVK